MVARFLRAIAVTAGLSVMLIDVTSTGTDTWFCLKSNVARDRQVCFQGLSAAPGSAAGFEGTQADLRAELERRASEARAHQRK
jgi:hypothetical protein